MKKKILAAAIGAMLVGGSAFAGVADTVRISTDGTGDLLIAPAYFIGGGMSTDLKVINTDQKKSVVAKVVFHHPSTSAEILDFLIYLTPGDVWTGTVSCLTVGPDGNCAASQVKSFDGSIQKPGEDVFASANDPAIIVSGLAVDGRSPLPNQGYVTILEARALNVLNTKDVLDAAGNVAATGRAPVGAVFGPGVLKVNLKTAYDNSSAVPIQDTDTPNVLTGTVTANSNVSGFGSATLPMTAIADYDNSAFVKVGTDTGLGAPRSYHLMSDLEDALWSNNYVVPYKIAPDSLSLVTFTFPTKQTWDNVVNGQYPFGVSTTRDAIGVAGVLGAADVAISATAFDNEENSLAASFVNISPLPPSKTMTVPEFGWKLIGGDLTVGKFTEGWLRVSYTPSSAFTAAATQSNGNVALNKGRSGAPALVTVMNKQAGNFTWAYAASAAQ